MSDIIRYHIDFPFSPHKSEVIAIFLWIPKFHCNHTKLFLLFCHVFEEFLIGNL